MPATQGKYTYGGLTLDVDLHYVGSVTATTHQEKGIKHLGRTPRGELYYQLHTAKGTSVKNYFQMWYL